MFIVLCIDLLLESENKTTDPFLADYETDSEGSDYDPNVDSDDMDDLFGDFDDGDGFDDPSTSGIIETYLASVKNKLIAELHTQALPSCYQNGSFWIHPPQPFFALKKSMNSIDGLNPSSIYYPAVFLWLPNLLDEKHKIMCPNPECGFYKKGANPMTIKCWNDNPIARRVVGLDQNYYVMTQRIQCRKHSGFGCGKSYNLYDPLILDQLDPGLVAEFPAFLTHRSGIDKTLMTLVRAGIAHRLSSSAWSKLPKYMMKLNGIVTFAALFTVVNEFEQIRWQAFVPTKALSHIKAGLEGMVTSLNEHGLPQPILGFTDNVASDYSTFVECIPSLSRDV
ncbi:hypothetical protein F5887DRAFT_904347, partial [Amanita rubescens]